MLRWKKEADKIFDDLYKHIREQARRVEDLGERVKQLECSHSFTSWEAVRHYGMLRGVCKTCEDCGYSTITPLRFLKLTKPKETKALLELGIILESDLPNIKYKGKKK